MTKKSKNKQKKKIQLEDKILSAVKESRKQIKQGKGKVLKSFKYLR